MVGRSPSKNRSGASVRRLVLERSINYPFLGKVAQAQQEQWLVRRVAGLAFAFRALGFWMEFGVGRRHLRRSYFQWISVWLDDGQSGGVPRDSVEGMIEFKLLVHDLDGSSQDVDISPGIVTPKGGLVKSQAPLDVVE